MRRSLLTIIAMLALVACSSSLARPILKKNAPHYVHRYLRKASRYRRELLQKRRKELRSSTEHLHKELRIYAARQNTKLHIRRYRRQIRQHRQAIRKLTTPELWYNYYGFPMVGLNGPQFIINRLHVARPDPFKMNSIGTVESAGMVQIIDDSQALIRLNGHLFWVKGIDTSQITSSDTVDFTGLWRISGTTQYTTVLGFTKTVDVLEPFDPRQYIKTTTERLRWEAVQNTRRKVRKLRTGLSEKEVKAIMGEPRGTAKSERDGRTLSRWTYMGGITLSLRDGMLRDWQIKKNK